MAPVLSFALWVFVLVCRSEGGLYQSSFTPLTISQSQTRKPLGGFNTFILDAPRGLLRPSVPASETGFSAGHSSGSSRHAKSGPGSSPEYIADSAPVTLFDAAASAKPNPATDVKPAWKTAVSHQSARKPTVGGGVAAEPQYSTLCGGHLDLQDGGTRFVISPNYPGQYPNDLYCEWKIMTGFGSQLKISSADFALEVSETCKNDYVQFFWANGIASSWTVGKHAVDRFCGTHGPLDLVFKDSNMIMTFLTDRSRTNRGFNISFSVFQPCAILFEHPNFQGTSTVLEPFYENSVWTNQNAEGVFTSIDVSAGCKLMICSDEKFEGTCHLFFKSNPATGPLQASWPRSASCMCS